MAHLYQVFLFDCFIKCYFLVYLLLFVIGLVIDSNVLKINLAVEVNFVDWVKVVTHYWLILLHFICYFEMYLVTNYSYYLKPLNHSFELMKCFFVNLEFVLFLHWFLILILIGCLNSLFQQFANYYFRSVHFVIKL